jgi:hypothetical protein
MNNFPNTQFVQQLAQALLSDLKIEVDILEMLNNVKKYNFTNGEFVRLFVFIADNVNYFENRLPQPAKLSNIMTYCGDALKMNEDNWHGSATRNRITGEVKILLFGVV